MAIVQLSELVDVVVMTFAIGFIFMDVFRKPEAADYDPLTHFKPGFDWESLKYAALITAPAVILHEIGHKVVALGMGMEAVFHAAYTWLGLGVLLKLMNFGFIFFVPAFVRISGVGTPLDFSLIAFAGPGVNLIFWLGSLFVLKQGLVKNKVWYHALKLTAKINMFLFIFNMLPIPGFDGFQVYSGIFKSFGF